MDSPRVACVGGVVLDKAGSLLLVLRGNEPDKGCWSIPGGRKEPGEADAAATAREVLEETGLPVRVGALLGSAERAAPDGSVYVIRDYFCTVCDGVDASDVRAGDDADDAAWFRPEQVRNLRCSPGLVQALEAWKVL